ncbi:anaphase-promoting complex protein [Verticillium dahliae VdLs.17]|uniref:Anaphase-promoting complex subunit 5 n=1 Tax=Verticillium dahliae (strain VdLs.17 / ATCC MYA-4575 / FGSC 10137) TaxID=498257 RepID=G2WXW5_VERDV|nr:anaphase-promoting complex protein [Verticillium dahliae VdLs.17]EGY20923.1 anaphase-promoting complex protein [Verticillium dahliae VdLs.17]
MARYLTPAKIGMLSLIELYTDEHVPNAAIIPVLSFITSHVLDYDPASFNSSNAASWDKAKKAVSIVVSIQDFESLLNPYPVLVGLPGRKLWDSFLDRLWDINSLHELHSFFERQSQAMVRSKEQLRRQGDEEPDQAGIRLTRNSPFGTFVRRCQLEFSRLRFHDSAELWKEFVKYRQPTVSYRRRRNPSFGRMSFDHVLEVGEHDDWDPEGVEALASVAYGGLLTSAEPSSLSVSTDDVELLLEFQIGQMQKNGNRVPVEVQHKFRDLLKDSVVVPSTTHYLSFLDAWRSGDYPTSFDYLHRYFDYTMQNRDRLYYQYALMNLAVLQADFGCHTDAITTMLETVSTARENRDMTCLNFSLNWLFHYGQAHPNLIRDLETDSVLGAGKESLAYLRVKAKETNMGTLWSSVLIIEAKLGLMNGESVATSLELLVRSSHLIVEKNMKNMFGAQLSMKMALLDRIGLAHLSNMESEMFLRCHARQSVFDDELKVTCRLAVQLAERGKYDDALKKLEALDENALRSWKPSQYWFKYRGIIKLTRDLRHNNLDGAEQILSQLLQSKMDDMEPDIAFMIDYLHIDCLKRRGDLSSAFEKVEDMLEELQEENRDLSLRLQLMLVKAHLYDKAGRPQRGFTLAMRAASMAWRARLVPNLWHAIGAIANILTSLGEFQAAIDLLTAILPRSLECDSTRLSGTLYSHLADANMGLAGSAPDGSARRTECMTRALRAVEKAFDCYSSVEEIIKQCEMMAKKATIMRVAGDKALAADCAATYVALRKHAAVLAM